MAKVAFHHAVDLKGFDYAGLLSGTFSDQTDTAFTLTAGKESITVEGSDFVYADGSPTGGTINSFDAEYKGHPDFAFSGLNLDVAQLQADLAANDTAALRADVFGGDDKIVGSMDADTLYGFDGADKLVGRDGADVLDGGMGRDKLVGGLGEDVFQFDSTDDLRDGADVIKDLHPDDVVDLSRIDADIHTDGDQAFTFVDHFSGTAGEASLHYDAGKDRTSLRMDVDGDGHADAVILMLGDHTDLAATTIDHPDFSGLIV